MKSTSRIAWGLASGLLASTAVANVAQAEDLTLCWAAWDPANALVELSKDFTAETGIGMKFEFVPWTNYADRFLNELNSKGKLCDLIIGDSQWIGGSAENGHYIKLNDFFAKEGITMDDFVPATVVGYSEWPKNTPNYWALPAMGDVVGWTYRKDWFAKPELQKEFKEKYGWDLAAPTTFEQLKQIAEFFQKREIDGKTVYGASIYTERGSEGVTMGAMDVLYSFGFKYENPDKPYDMEGFVNSDEVGEGSRVLQGALRLLHASRRFQQLHGRRRRRVQIRSGGDAHELRLHLARPAEGRGGRRRQDRLSSSIRRGPKATSSRSSAARASRWSPTPSTRMRLFKYIKWFANKDVQAKWWSLGGFSCLKAVVDDPKLPGKPALCKDVPGVDGHREGLLGGAELRLAAAGFAEAPARLCRRRPGQRQGCAGRPGQGLDRSVRGRRQDVGFGRLPRPSRVV